MTAPSTTGSDGRDGRGRFAPGNRIANGNPYASHFARLRSPMLSAVCEKDMVAIVQRRVALARGGNV